MEPAVVAPGDVAGKMIYLDATYVSLVKAEVLLW
jgi:hypothetical protein